MRRTADDASVQCPFIHGATLRALKCVPKAAHIGCGGVGAARAIETLRGAVSELQMADGQFAAGATKRIAVCRE